MILKLFVATKHMKKSTIRTIFSIDIEKTGDDIVISYTGDGFLQNMIRIITGSLSRWAMEGKIQML